jgi:cob(I)alamin adenosyltransferase
MIHYYYGFGKGKTTAAMGMVLRQINIDHRVLIAQFLKDGTSGEIQQLQANSLVTIMVNPPIENYLDGVTEAQKVQIKNEQRELFARVKADCQAYECIILDEITDLIKLEVLGVEELAEWLIDNQFREIVVTGHYLNDRLYSIADYVTEFSAVKHPFSKGIKARKGVEF